MTVTIVLTRDLSESLSAEVEIPAQYVRDTVQESVNAMIEDMSGDDLQDLVEDSASSKDWEPNDPFSATFNHAVIYNESGNEITEICR